MDLRFKALEYGDDQDFHPVEMRYCGSMEKGWEIQRNGQPHLHLGPGYLLLRTSACGVCSTDLARHHLPFPLPQITGHEVLAVDPDGGRYAVEINASHWARGVESDCTFCKEGLDKHCPERLVLGIHDLPGGFGPWILVPRNSLVPLRKSFPDSTALLLEPFAAALHLADFCPLEEYSRIAVLGPRRLGQLVIASLAALRRQQGLDFHLTALTRHASLADLAGELGADEAVLIEGSGEELPSSAWDLVIDTTGAPAGLDLALRLASKEVHLKSTHGQPAAGLANSTAMVVDEIAMGRMPTEPAGWDVYLGWEPIGELPKLLWTCQQAPPPGLASRAEITEANPRALTGEHLGRFEIAVVDTLESADRVIRPYDDREVSYLRPCGTLLLDAARCAEEGPLARAIRDKDLRLSTSRCGSLNSALSLLESDPLGKILGNLIISRDLQATDLPIAFALARSPETIKIAIHHPSS